LPKGGHPIFFFKRKSKRKINSLKTTTSKWRPISKNTPPFESLEDSVVWVWANLLPLTNSGFKPFDKLRVNSISIRYATHGWPPSIPYADSKVQREAL
jgi:hypothetical protein